MAYSIKQILSFDRFQIRVVQVYDRHVEELAENMEADLKAAQQKLNENPITIANINGVIKVIDGNHRLEAIRRLIENKNVKFNIDKINVNDKGTLSEKEAREFAFKANNHDPVLRNDDESKINELTRYVEENNNDSRVLIEPHVREYYKNLFQINGQKYGVLSRKAIGTFRPPLRVYTKNELVTIQSSYTGAVQYTSAGYNLWKSGLESLTSKMIKLRTREGTMIVYFRNWRDFDEYTKDEKEAQRRYEFYNLNIKLIVLNHEV